MGRERVGLSDNVLPAAASLVLQLPLTQPLQLDSQARPQGHKGTAKLTRLPAPALGTSRAEPARGLELEGSARGVLGTDTCVTHALQ
eukprot:2636154-Pyramimonas_sp.AAC.1